MNCIIFQGYKNKDGYGSKWHKGRAWLAHRLAYTLEYGDIPKGMSVMHTCDNPSCVNPQHLKLGTHHENMLDRKNKGRGGYLKGTANGRQKLTEQDIHDIRNSSLNGVQLAEKYGVHNTTIYDIRKRKIWSHI